jgi:thiol-disulfide isomerase/thioredoxin
VSSQLQENRGSRSGAGRRYQLILVAVVVALFVVILGVKLNGTSNGAASGSPRAVRADAVAAFERAQAGGKPVFVLFHSLTCDPCVEISANVDQVLPAYEGKVAFVNAITDDASAQRLAARFQFQYIPTSFFLGPDGRVVDTHTGVLSPDELKARLDRLVAQ